MYYKHSEENATDTSCASTIEPPTGYLRLIFEDREFEWFQITPQLIADITFELFIEKLCAYFELLADELIIQDQFGIVVNTVDLRRCLMVLTPRLRISRWREQPRLPTAPITVPAKFCVRVTKQSHADKVGFAIVDSVDESRLVISEIKPDSVLANRDIDVGDEIVSVNGHTSISRMRRELSTALTVVLQIEKSLAS